MCYIQALLVGAAGIGVGYVICYYFLWGLEEITRWWPFTLARTRERRRLRAAKAQQRAEDQVRAKRGDK